MPAVELMREACKEVRKEMECKELLQTKLRDAEEKQLQHAFAKEKARLLKQTTYLEKRSTHTNRKV